MKNLLTYEKFLLENDYQIPRTSIDNPEGTVTPVVIGEEIDEYMFFQNLKTIKNAIDSIMKMDPDKVNSILRDGHAWAVDHIATSKDDVEEVAGFLKGRLSEGRISESSTSNFNRIFSMTPMWWEAWKKENEGKYEIKKDAFTKTYDIAKDGKTLFVFDYGRNKIFTNEDPRLFVIQSDLSQEEVDSAEERANKLTTGVSKKKEKKEKEDSFSDELNIDKNKSEEE
jgi:hypothetical protein